MILERGLLLQQSQEWAADVSNEVLKRGLLLWYCGDGSNEGGMLVQNGHRKGNAQRVVL